MIDADHEQQRHSKENRKFTPVSPVCGPQGFEEFSGCPWERIITHYDGKRCIQEDECEREGDDSGPVSAEWCIDSIQQEEILLQRYRYQMSSRISSANSVERSMFRITI